ncbi:MbeD/MobD family mobilization/exclusion protein [Streptomyces platensis]
MVSSSGVVTCRGTGARGARRHRCLSEQVNHLSEQVNHLSEQVTTPNPFPLSNVKHITGHSPLAST